MSRNCWLLVHVSKVYRSDDAHVRSVQVALGDHALSTKGYNFRPVRHLDRPIHKLVLLLQSSSVAEYIFSEEALLNHSAVSRTCM